MKFDENYLQNREKLMQNIFFKFPFSLKFRLFTFPAYFFNSLQSLLNIPCILQIFQKHALDFSLIHSKYLSKNLLIFLK